MGEPSFWDNIDITIRDFIGHIAWVVFLWSIRMSEERYHACYRMQVEDELKEEDEMTDLYLCPIGWELYDKWDTLCRDCVTHDPSADEQAAENAAWTALLDHKAKCDICRKDEECETK